MSKDSAFEGFDSPNTTPVPDALFDELLSELSGAELKVLLYIIRRTFGFKKASDAICLDQFEHGITTRDGKILDKGTGLSRDTITLTLQSLEKRGCIKREDRYKQPTVYRLRMKDEEIEKSTRIKGRKTRTKNPAVSPENQDVVSPENQHAENSVSESCFSGFLSPDFTETQETVLQETDKQESVPTIAAPPPCAIAPHTRSSSISEKESGSQQQAPTQENQQPVTVRKDAAEKKPARANKPAMDEVTQKRIDAVYETLDEFKQKVTDNPDAKYQRYQTDTDAILNVLLPQNPTPRSLLQVCKDMWNEKDRNGNHFWQKHMRPHNICNQYESRIMALEGKDRLEIPDPEKPRTTVSGYQDYTPAPGAPLQQFRPLARARR